MNIMSEVQKNQENKFEHMKLWYMLKFNDNVRTSNFDTLNSNDNLISEHIGDIKKLRYIDNKAPIPIADFSYSVWNFKLDRIINNKLINVMSDFIKTFIDNGLFKNHQYFEIFNAFKNKTLNINTVDRLIIINTLIVHPEYKGKNIPEEFVEFIYKQFNNENDIILSITVPIQNNYEDFNHYNKYKSIEIKNDIKTPTTIIKAKDYYDLNNLKSDDEEIDFYKVYSVATRCGFDRINDTNIFILKPKVVLDRLLKKANVIYKYNN
jgi:hypothetical protein